MTAVSPAFTHALALTFGSPELLTGLLLVGVPVILHWLYRRPQREERWAAMDILRRALAKRSQRMRLQTWLLLAVRMLLIAAAALAFARPFAAGLAGSAAAPRAVRRVIVIDATLSMQSHERGDSPFDSARRLATRILESSRPGDTVRVIKIGPLPSKNELIRNWSSDAPGVATEVNRLTPTEGAGDAYATLKTAATWLESDPAGAVAEVIVLSDFQRSDWHGSQVRTASAATIVESLDKRAKVTLIPLGERQADNLSIASVRTDESLVRSLQPATIVVSIENAGRTARSQVAVEALLAGSVRGVARVDVPAGGSSEARVAVEFDREGTSPLQVRIPDDALPADNVAQLVVRVRDRLRVLLVDQGARSGRPARPTEFVRLALKPETLSGSDPTPDSVERFDVRQIDIVNLRDEDLSDWDCIYLCGVSRLTKAEAERITQFVSKGGALIVSAAPNIDVDNWNSHFYRDGNGPLPAHLAGWENIEDAKATFVLGSPPHPALDPFIGNPDAGLTTTRVWEFMRTDHEPQTQLVSLTSGRPAVLEKKFGKGLCILSAVSLEGQGSNWVVWPSFLPLIQELTAYGISATDPDPVVAGQPVAFETKASGTVRIALPNGTEVDRPVPIDRTEIVFEDTERAGIYTLKDGGTPGQDRMPIQSAAVNPDPRESRIDRLTTDELRTMFGHAVSIQSEWQPPSAGGPGSGTAERELSQPVLWALLALILTEAALTWRFHWGAGLAVAFALTFALWPIGGPWLAALAGIAAGAALAFKLQGRPLRLKA